MDNNKGMAIGLIALLIIGLGIIGFVVMGGSDDEEEASSTETSQVTENAESEQVPAQDNIVELAQATDDLSTLVAAVVAADLVDTLASESAEFTVFAPTNAAFDALPEGTLDTLLEPANVGDLTDILTYHVVPNEAFSTDLSDGMVLETVLGEELQVSISDGVVKINDATVVQADIDASNGVVHVIDTVLLP